MRKRYKIIALSVGAILCLSGCNARESEPDRYVVVNDEGMTVAGLTAENLTTSATERPNFGTIQQEDLELEADFLGLYEVLDSDEIAEIPSSQLIADKTYEARARILLSTDSETIVGHNLEFLLTSPLKLEKGKKADFEVQMLVDEAIMAIDDFAVAATQEVNLEYAPESYRIRQSGKVRVPVSSEDVIWNVHAPEQLQTLSYQTQLDQKMGVYEYTLKFWIEVKVADTQQAISLDAELEPIQLELKGIRQEFVDEPSNNVTEMRVLASYLSGDYLASETIYANGCIYLVAEAELPDWARRYAEEYGLMVTWYNYRDSAGCGVGLSLPYFPDNLGHVEESFQDLAIVALKSENPDAVGGELVSYPTLPLTLWQQDETQAFGVAEIATLVMPTEGDRDPRQNRDCVTQFVGGEIVEQFPQDEPFYIILGTNLAYITEDDTAEELVIKIAP